MAERREDDGRAERVGGGEPERSSPLGVTVALMLGFLMLAIVGVITVVVPELTDGHDEADERVPGAPVEERPAAAPSSTSTPPSR